MPFFLQPITKTTSVRARNNDRNLKKFTDARNAQSGNIKVIRPGVTFIGLPGRIQPFCVYQTPIQAGRFFVWLVLGMAVTKNEVSTLIVQIVVVLAAWGPVPFT